MLFQQIELLQSLLPNVYSKAADSSNELRDAGRDEHDYILEIISIDDLNEIAYKLVNMTILNSRYSIDTDRQGKTTGSIQLASMTLLDGFKYVNIGGDE